MEQPQSQQVDLVAVEEKKEAELPAESMDRMSQLQNPSNVAGIETTGLRNRKSKRISSESGQRQEQEQVRPVSAVSSKSNGQVDLAESVLTFFSYIAILILSFELLGVNMKSGDVSFWGDWLDLIGTISYIRSRNDVYSARSSRSLGSFAYSLIVSFLLYRVSGLLTKSIMRKTVILPTVSSFFEFFVLGFLPVHFFPGDYIFTTLEGDDRYRMIVSGAWALSKLKSLIRMNREAVEVHDYSFLYAFALSVASCEIASLVGRFEINLKLHSWKGATQKFIPGINKWLSSTSLRMSLLTSIFIALSAQLLSMTFVWLPFALVALCTVFYRYSNGLLERFLSENVNVENVTTLLQRKAKRYSSRKWSSELQTDMKLLQDLAVHLFVISGPVANTVFTTVSHDVRLQWSAFESILRSSIPSSSKDLNQIIILRYKEVLKFGSAAFETEDVLNFFGVVAIVVGTAAALLFSGKAFAITALLTLPYPLSATIKAWNEHVLRNQWVPFWAIWIAVETIELVLLRRSTITKNPVFVGAKLIFLYWCAVLEGAKLISTSTDAVSVPDALLASFEAAYERMAEAMQKPSNATIVELVYEKLLGLGTNGN